MSSPFFFPDPLLVCVLEGVRKNWPFWHRHVFVFVCARITHFVLQVHANLISAPLTRAKSGVSCLLLVALGANSASMKKKGMEEQCVKRDSKKKESHLSCGGRKKRQSERRRRRRKKKKKEEDPTSN